MISVILADDHNIVRNGIRNLLEQDGRFEVIAEASGAELFEVLDKGVIPEIILADAILPDLGNFTEKFKKAGITPKLVVLTVADGDEHMVQAFKSGVMGYLLKTISSDELAFALSFIHRHNKKYISADLALRMVDRLSDHSRFNHDGFDGVVFTKRESEVLELIADGHTNQQIADKLFTSKRTVEGHRQALMDKARVANSAALVQFAFRNKLID